MIRGEEAATDVMSSLPIIAMCVVSVGILLVALTGAISNHAERSPDVLSERCESLLESATRLLTPTSEEGSRFLTPDWQTRIADLNISAAIGGGFSSQLRVRILGHPSIGVELSGNITSCEEIRTMSSAFMFTESGFQVPGEMIAAVGI